MTDTPPPAAPEPGATPAKPIGPLPHEPAPTPTPGHEHTASGSLEHAVDAVPPAVVNGAWRTVCIIAVALLLFAAGGAAGYAFAQHHRPYRSDTWARVGADLEQLRSDLRDMPALRGYITPGRLYMYPGGSAHMYPGGSPQAVPSAPSSASPLPPQPAPAGTTPAGH